MRMMLSDAAGHVPLGKPRRGDELFSRLGTPLGHTQNLQETR